MAKQDEIKKAIGAHGLWKTKLKNAIAAGKADPTPAQASVDNACEFGKWLYSMPADQQKDAHYNKVKELHAQFHKEASNVLRLVETGKAADATKAIGGGSNFERITTALTMTLMEWSKTA